MKKSYLILLFLIVISVMNAQTLETRKSYYDYSKTKLKEVFTVTPNTNTKNGVYKFYLEGGELLFEANFLDGYKNGQYKVYYNAENTSINAYCDGCIGKPHEIKTYKNDVLTESIDLKYLKDKTVACKTVTTYSNGAAIKEEMFYADGKKAITAPNNGTVIMWDYKGVKTCEAKMLNGALDGLWTQWFTNGKLSNTGNYKNNLKVGIWKGFYENGNVKYEVDNGEDGKLVYEKTFNEDGSPADEGTKLIIANEYNSKAWNQITAKDFAAAVISCNKGLEYNPNSLYLIGNLAHAYLFLGEYEKALAIYKKYLTQQLQENLSWEDMIKNDFSEFKTLGFDLVIMDKVLTELSLK